MIIFTNVAVTPCLMHRTMKKIRDTPYILLTIISKHDQNYDEKSLEKFQLKFDVRIELHRSSSETKYTEVDNR